MAALLSWCVNIKVAQALSHAACESMSHVLVACSHWLSSSSPRRGFAFDCPHALKEALNRLLTAVVYAGHVRMGHCLAF